MKANKKQWVFGLGMAILMAISSLSIPALADQMISAKVDNVQVDAAQTERKRNTTDTSAEALVGYQLSDKAIAKLTEHGRKAFKDVFDVEIPEDYREIDTKAYEEEGDLRYSMLLMPPDWEASVDPMPTVDEQPYYSIFFGSVNIETGEAALLGLQQFILKSIEDETYVEVEYTDEQIDAMEEAARAFAATLGMEIQARIQVDKVSGTFTSGCILTFSMADGKTLSITVSKDGEVSGYSLVLGKG